MKTDLHFQQTLSKLQNFQQTSIQLLQILYVLKHTVSVTTNLRMNTLYGKVMEIENPVYLSEKLAIKLVIRLK